MVWRSSGALLGGDASHPAVCLREINLFAIGSFLPSVPYAHACEAYICLDLHLFHTDTHVACNYRTFTGEYLKVGKAGFIVGSNW